MFLVTKFTKSDKTYYSGSVEGMTKNFEQAKEMLMKLQILAGLSRKRNKKEAKDTSDKWSDLFVISHTIDKVNFTSYDTSYKEVMKE